MSDLLAIVGPLVPRDVRRIVEASARRGLSSLDLSLMTVPAGLEGTLLWLGHAIGRHAGSLDFVLNPTCPLSSAHLRGVAKLQGRWREVPSTQVATSDDRGCFRARLRSALVRDAGLSLHDLAEMWRENPQTIESELATHRLRLERERRSVRIGRALTLLVYSDSKLSAIAEESGFKSLSWFVEAFHREVGTGAVQVRRAIRGAE